MKLIRLALYALIALSLQIATAMSFADTESSHAGMSANQTQRTQTLQDMTMSGAMMDEMEDCCSEPCDEMPDCADICATSASSAGNTGLKQATSGVNEETRPVARTVFPASHLAALKSKLADRQPKPPKA